MAKIDTTLLLSDWYKDNREKKQQLATLIKSLEPLIQNISDAIQLIPLLKEYLELDVKNSDQIVKVLQILANQNSKIKIKVDEDDDIQLIKNKLRQIENESEEKKVINVRKKK